MGLISKIFGFNEEKNKNRETNNNQEQHEHFIRYKEDLIDILKEDHNDLFEMYSKMVEDAKKGNYEKIPKTLKDFKTSLNMHVYIENIQLYSYITHYYENAKEQLKFIDNVQRDMSVIVKEVTNFVEEWIDLRITDSNKEIFLKSLEEIGEVLTKRVKMEEKRLYILYQK